ncbi:MAG: hypothetical protein WD578_12530 [Bacteroidales bacterium]
MIEEKTKNIKEGNTNYFQLDKEPLSSPGNVRFEKNKLMWDTAIAGDEPIEKYVIYSGDIKVGEVSHRPQTSNSPFVFKEIEKGKQYTVAAVDRAGKMASVELFT